MTNCVAAQKSIVIIAGETSGDLHGSKLVRAMRAGNENLFFCGIGGPALKDAGVRILIDAAELTVVGITEVFGKLPTIYRAMARIKKLLRSLQPDLLILIDFPDFNLNIAATAKKVGIPVLYYVSPQIWAWRPGRVKRIGRLVDHMAVILPFEETFYKQHNVAVTFVGHPLLDTDLPSIDELLMKESSVNPVVGLVPGSRESEITRHLPVMLDSAVLLKQHFKAVEFIVSRAPGIGSGVLETIVKHHPMANNIEIVADDIAEVLKRSDLIIAASGTVTLQAALYGTPMVIIYKVSPLSAWVAGALVRVNHIGLVNLVAGKEIVPEFLQHQASPENLASAVIGMLDDGPNLARLKNELLELRNALGGAGASLRVADIAMQMLSGS
jgi:lipid-A-disaccharide synthase